MNLKEQDLSALSKLWQLSSGNASFKAEVAAELDSRIEKNKNFSREDIYHVCKVLNKTLTVMFIPTSDSYNKYGPHITIELLPDDPILEELTSNFLASPRILSYGILRAKSLVSGSLIDEQEELLSNEGFNTQDILETRHY